MKELTMLLRTIPDGWYLGVTEQIYCISPEKVYMVRQLFFSKDGDYDYAHIKYLFRLPTKDKVYESLITEQLYEGIRADINFSNSEIKNQQVFEFLFGKDTIRVIDEYNFKTGNDLIFAIGPEENKEWQYEFQKFHI